MQELELKQLPKKAQIMEETKVEAKVEKKLVVTTSKKEQVLGDLPGVGAATEEKLAAAGFDTPLSIAVATPGELVEASGVTESVARKMIQCARDNFDMGFQSGEDIMKKREKVIRISSGSKNFDTMLAGGFETGSIVECFGQYGSSKTQIGHALAVNCQLSDPTAVAVYIDTENTFRPERIRQFALGKKLDPDKVLRNIKVARAFNSDHQMLLAEKVEELIKQGLNVRIVIVDSLTAHFRAEFVGRGTLAERQQKLNKHMHVLAKVADMYNLCVYVTNQVMARPDTFFGDPTEAIGGNIVGHNSTFRIYLRRGKKGTRVGKLIDAPNLPDSECIFQITEHGIEDA
ncbi:MAG: DNA repair and recombination protein RadA [Nanoarchaeota archaeon]